MVNWSILTLYVTVNYSFYPSSNTTVRNLLPPQNATTVIAQPQVLEENERLKRENECLKRENERLKRENEKRR